MGLPEIPADNTRMDADQMRAHRPAHRRFLLRSGVGGAIAGGLWLSAWAATAAAQLPNNLAGLGTPSTSTTTTSVAVSTTSTGTTSATKVVTIAVIAAAIVLIAVIAMYIVRDARRNAPIKASATAGYHQMTRSHEENRRRRRDKRSAQRAARKRNR